MAGAEKMVGVDIGSGGCKIAIVNTQGEVLASAFEEYDTQYPHPGWAEQEPSDWLKALKLALARALALCRAKPREIASLAIGAATHTLVLLDKQAKPLRPAMLWRDKRSIAQVMRLRQEHGSEIFRRTLHQANVNWTLPYLLWIREVEPEIWALAHKLLMPKDYVRLQLTGEMATDYMDAHGTLLYDVRRRCWSEEICRLADIPQSLLPEVRAPEQLTAGVSRAAAQKLGLHQGTPVVIGTTDQAAEAFGSGAVNPGQGILKLATAGNVAVVSQEPHPVPLKVYAYYHLKPQYWYTLAGTISCAVCYRWLRDALCQPEVRAAEIWGLNEYRLMDRLARQAPPGCEGLLFHPHLQGAIWDPYLRADFVGITSRHQKEHFVRAVLEGVSFSLYNCVKELDELGVAVKDFRIIGGGAKSKLWRQITCDIVGKPLLRPAVDDASFGTALLGGLGVGIFASIDEAAAKCVRQLESMKPDMERHTRYQELFGVYRQVQEDLAAASLRLHQVLHKDS